MSGLFHGLVPVCRKEFLHIIRDPGTLFFALLIPMLQLFLFGFAVDTNIRQVSTVVLDESHTQESRRLLESFAGSDVFNLKIYAGSQDEMYERNSRREGSCWHSHSLRLCAAVAGWHYGDGPRACRRIGFECRWTSDEYIYRRGAERVARPRAA